MGRERIILDDTTGSYGAVLPQNVLNTKVPLSSFKGQESVSVAVFIQHALLLLITPWFKAYLKNEKDKLNE